MPEPTPIRDDDRDRRALFAMMREYFQVGLEIDAAVAWRKAAEMDSAETLGRLNARRDDLQAQIELLARDFLVGTSKHLDLPGLGRIQFRETPAGLRIADPEAFMAALGSDERALLVETRDHLRTNEAKQYAETVLQESGEIVAGVERTEARTTASITLREAP